MNVHSTEYICTEYQELMNRHGEKERLTSVSILCRITLQNMPYKDYNLLALTSFEVAIVTTMDSQKPACWDDDHLLACRCEHAAYLIRRILEALNSSEDGTINVWQLDAPSRCFAVLISS